MRKEFDAQVERNLRDSELEKAGNVDEAIRLYEQNVGEDFIGNHPYDRLAVIYRRRNQTDDEIRVLERAVAVFQNKVGRERTDRLPKLERFKDRLKKAQSLRALRRQERMVPNPKGYEYG